MAHGHQYPLGAGASQGQGSTVVGTARAPNPLTRAHTRCHRSVGALGSLPPVPVEACRG